MQKWSNYADVTESIFDIDKVLSVKDQGPSHFEIKKIICKMFPICEFHRIFAI